MQTIPDLKGEFYCYERHNPHGFKGELRDAVIKDLTIWDFVEQHVQNWNFQNGFNQKKIHELSHPILAISTQYFEDLSRLRIEKDPETHLLKAQGYNGFMEGEYFAIAIQLLLRDINDGLTPIAFQQYTNNFIIEIFEDAVISADKNYGHIISQNDMEYWLRAGRSDTPTSLFEEKYCDQFPLDLNLHNDVAMCVGRQNKHGETLKEYREPSNIELKTLTMAVKPLMLSLHRVRNSGQKNLRPCIVNMLEKMPMRDLHRLIGGDKAAKKYFKLCGISETEISEIFSKPVPLSAPQGHIKKAVALPTAP